MINNNTKLNKKFETKKSTFFVFDDFLSEESLAKILFDLTSTKWEKFPPTSLGPDADFMFSYVSSSVLEELFSGEIQEYITSLFDKEISFNDKCVPMYSCHRRGSGGLIIHNDKNNHPENDRDIVLILYLNEGWEGTDANLLIYNENKKKKLSIKPTLNRAVIFNVSDDSWHSLEKNNYIKDRYALYMDWIYV